MNSLFRAPFGSRYEHFPPTPAGGPNSGVTRSGSLSQHSLHRGKSITKRLSDFKSTLLLPFALKSPNAISTFPQPPMGSDTAHPAGTEMPKTSRTVHTAMPAPRPTFLSRALRSDNPDPISLPFRLSITHIHEKAHRQVPYLRQSWSRIDFIAIVSFWITFALAMTGEERGRYHIGIFRAMSVIRTARLLTITSGTTVRDLTAPHSSTLR